MITSLLRFDEASVSALIFGLISLSKSFTNLDAPPVDAEALADP